MPCSRITLCRNLHMKTITNSRGAKKVAANSVYSLQHATWRHDLWAQITWLQGRAYLLFRCGVSRDTQLLYFGSFIVRSVTLGRYISGPILSKLTLERSGSLRVVFTLSLVASQNDALPSFELFVLKPHLSHSPAVARANKTLVSTSKFPVDLISCSLVLLSFED